MKIYGLKIKNGKSSKTLKHKSLTLEELRTEYGEYPKISDLLHKYIKALELRLDGTNKILDSSRQIIELKDGRICKLKAMNEVLQELLLSHLEKSGGESKEVIYNYKAIIEITYQSISKYFPRGSIRKTLCTIPFNNFPSLAVIDNLINRYLQKMCISYETIIKMKLVHLYKKQHSYTLVTGDKLPDDMKTIFKFGE